MKAALREGPGRVRCVELPRPAAGAGQVVIRVKASGICGSDLHRVADPDRKWDTVVLGHEFAGIVEEVGEGVTGLALGDRVSAVPLVPCMRCSRCQEGNYSLCPQYSFIGSRVHGALAELVTVPAQNVLRLPDELAFEEAALLEPLSVCLHPLMRRGSLLGRTVVVLGAGAIGLLALQAARAGGAHVVIATDVVDENLALARRLGADLTVNAAREKVPERVRDVLQGDGADLVVESSGTTPGKRTAVAVARGRGEILLVGTSPQDVSFDAALFERISRRELSLHGSWMNYSAPFPGAEWSTAIWLLSSGRVKGGPLITHRFPLERVGEAFQAKRTNGAAVIKVVIEP